MLANDLAKTVAYLGTAIISISWLPWKPLRFLSRLSWSSSRRTEFLDRADADAVSFPECAIHRSSLCDAHLGTMNQGRDIGWIRVAIADETPAIARRINDSSK